MSGENSKIDVSDPKVALQILVNVASNVQLNMNDNTLLRSACQTLVGVIGVIESGSESPNEGE